MEEQSINALGQLSSSLPLLATTTETSGTAFQDVLTAMPMEGEAPVGGPKRHEDTLAEAAASAIAAGLLSPGAGDTALAQVGLHPMEVGAALVEKRAEAPRELALPVESVFPFTLTAATSQDEINLEGAYVSPGFHQPANRPGMATPVELAAVDNVEGFGQDASSGSDPSLLRLTDPPAAEVLGAQPQRGEGMVLDLQDAPAIRPESVKPSKASGDAFSPAEQPASEMGMAVEQEALPMETGRHGPEHAEALDPRGRVVRMAAAAVRETEQEGAEGTFPRLSIEGNAAGRALASDETMVRPEKNPRIDETHAGGGGAVSSAILTRNLPVHRGELSGPGSHRGENLSPVSAQVGHTILRMVRGGKEKLRLRLRPPELGEIEMQIVREGDTFQILMRVERPATQSMLEQDASALLGSLRDAGLKVAGFSVRQGGEGDAGPFERQPAERRERRPPAVPTPTARKESAPVSAPISPPETALHINRWV